MPWLPGLLWSGMVGPVKDPSNRSVWKLLALEWITWYHITVQTNDYYQVELLMLNRNGMKNWKYL